MKLVFDQLTFEAAHYIPQCGKCSGIHGHTYTIKDLQIVIPTGTGFELTDNGLSIDFAEIKNYFNEQWDHKFMILKEDEEYWKHIFEECGIAPVLDNRKIVWGSTAEAMAMTIQEALEKIVYDRYPKLRDLVETMKVPSHIVSFTLYEGPNHGVSV